MENGTAPLVPLAALLVGIVFGLLAQRSHFCTMGCVSDAVLFGSWRRLRIWALAVAVALLGSQALEFAGLVDLGATSYRATPLFWLGAILGGLVFGFGMVQAGGCLSRNLIRLGSGSLKAMMTLLVAAVAAYAALSGVLAPLRSALLAWGAVDVGPDQGLPALLAGESGLDQAAAVVLTVAMTAGLLVFVWRDRQLRRSPEELTTGLLLGVLVPLTWLITSWPSVASSTPSEPQSLSFVSPLADSLFWLMVSGPFGFGVALVLGTLIGAAAMAGFRGQLRLETFAGRDDMVRHLVGGAMMGFGGVLAQGCSIGQGLSGVATLSLGSWLALASILAGGWWGVRHLETGRLLPFRAPAQAKASSPG
jgi:uncharacterized membrane protein YedE/YeeE